MDGDVTVQNNKDKRDRALSSSYPGQHHSKSNNSPSICSSRPHNNHQLSAQLLLCVGHREEELSRLHGSDESRHAGPVGMCALAHDGR